MSEIYDVIVVGGGAAGLWAAGTAAERGLSVRLVEKNRKLGVKILMSGGTRCNVTHNCDVRGILDAFGTEQGRFLKHSVHQLPPEHVVAMLDSLGVPTKVEDTGKVFPVSDRAIDVRDALVRRAEAAGAQLQSGTAVVDIDHAADGWSVHLSEPGQAQSKSKSEETIHSRQLLICCGGLSYSGCGTTGDGYAWAKKFGHELVATAPALTPLVCSEPWVHELSGLTLPDASARISVEGVKLAKDPRATSRGGVLWTHFGFSGPVPMNVSRAVTNSQSEGKRTTMSLDLAPDLKHEQIEMELSSSAGGRKNVGSVVQQFAPKNLARALLNRANVNSEVTLAELPKKSRQKLAADIKGILLPIEGTRGYAKAEVTQGGVNLSEVNTRTLESRIVPSLYFAGEILNIDGPIGGYNFQAAFATGQAAAVAMKPRGVDP
ncbi:MAG: NAD(P)/FAD-dependent oxidoreductase [Aureliella sp.]